MKKLNIIINFFLKYLEDFLIFGGIFFIIIATYKVNYIAGMYVTGFILVILGLYFSKYPIYTKKVR